MLTLQHRLEEDNWATALRIDQELRTKVPTLTKPFLATWEHHHRLFTHQRKPWLLSPLEIDPYRNRSGGYPLPDHVAADLRAISESGAQFHRIAIAHELDPEGPVSTYDKDVPPHGAELTHAQAVQYLGLAPAAEESKESVRRIDEGLRKAGRAVRAIGEGAVIAAAAIPAAMVVDPIVFGVVGLGELPQPSRPVIYYPLAAWNW